MESRKSCGATQSTPEMSCVPGRRSLGLPMGLSGQLLTPPRGQGGLWTGACVWARLGGARGRAGQGCGELESSPAAASLGLPWGPGPSAGWGTSQGTGLGQQGLVVPSEPDTGLGSLGDGDPSEREVAPDTETSTVSVKAKK